MKESRGNRLHIAFLGKMNTGKSSIINALFNREISIVSEFEGTTTDVVQKAIELLPLGPLSIMDTAGLNDSGTLGEKRVQKTYEALERTDAAVVVFDNNGVDSTDIELFNELKRRKIPVLSIINKIDYAKPCDNDIKIIEKNSDNTIKLSVKNDPDAATKIKQGLISILGEEYISNPPILSDIINKGEGVILVIPIDKEAPKGRIILPQVQTLRELLDNSAISTVCGVDTLKNAINSLKYPPKIVITDSQAFKEVSQIVPDDIMLTSFSILFARLKGDLKTFVIGADILDKLCNGDKILICESCSHHPVEDDIGRVKIPDLIKKYTGKDIKFSFVSGHTFPDDIEKYKLIVHCGACMTNRREVLSRIEKTSSKGVFITNYGIVIAKCTGILERVLEPFKN